MTGYRRVTKREWQEAGGLRNSRCVRVTRGGRWAYFIAVEGA